VAATNTYGIDPGYFNELVNLAKQGKLSGVPVQIMAAIQAAENPFGKPFNPSVGQTGPSWFGLQPGSTYPAGQFTVADLNNGNTTAGYQQQAQIAASQFAYDLKQSGGNIYAAESNYQGPSAQGEGVNTFKQFGIPQNISQITGTTTPAPAGQSITNPPGTPNTPNTPATQGAATPLGTLSFLGISIPVAKIEGVALMAGGGIIMLVGMVLFVKGESTGALVKGLVSSRGGGSSSSGPAPAPPAPTETVGTVDPDAALNAAYGEGYLTGQREANTVRQRRFRVVGRDEDEDFSEYGT
jgi:hypothetical protein